MATKQDVRLDLTTVTLGAPNARALADFYAALLGWSPSADDDGEDWVSLRNPAGGVGLAFQTEQFHEPPTWPGEAGGQHMQVHLEIRVDDLDAALTHAVDCGARPAEFQPQDDVRVCLDPAGHPFCLWIET